ncbi:MAG TPA: hypothetical protein VEK76_10010 [Candidatus Binatia bacterium]|nr:hypothetical protein [Candidatus Binatia bacterium]
MEKRMGRRSLKVALVAFTAVAGTALVGWGGLAAWNAYTENAGNSVAAGTLTHNNYVSANCASNLGTVPVSSGPGWCSAFITVTNVDPAAGLPVTGNVKIDNTGSLQSTFAMSMPAAAVGTGGTICQDLTLSMTDKNGTNVYPAAALSTQMGSTSLKNNAATPSTTWSPNGVAGTGSGATGNTFTFTVAAGGGFANDFADAGQSCSFNILFTQTAA